MAFNPSLRELIDIFQGTLEEDVVSGVFHDMHGNGGEAIQILRQLQSSMEVQNSQPTPDRQRNSRTVENNRGSWSQKTNITGRGTNFKVSNSVKDTRRLNPAGVKIPGYHDKKALYIMRGLSGSGKTTYAKKIVNLLGSGEIFSSDDFFMLNEANEYRFVHADLQIAHTWNQQRVEGALSEGLSPVIVDNTNTQFWEMRPYVIAGVEQGYSCYFIEPPTEWKFKINQLFRKSKHGLNKGQLVAALKRYEKNPTVEKVIGPAYLSKLKHSHSAGENSNVAGYVPFTTVNNDKNDRNDRNKKKSTEGPLVPYVLSDSDDPDYRDKGSEKRGTPQNQGTSVKNREYNNNSKCPKVRTQSPVPRAAWDSGSGDLGMSGKKSKQNLPQFSSQKKETWGTGIKSELRNAESDENEDWDQDMSVWLEDIAAREMEDELLDKLEKQQSTEIEEDLSVVIDIHKLREESVKKLSTWDNEKYIKTGVPQGCNNAKMRNVVSSDRRDRDIPVDLSGYDIDIPELEDSDEEIEMEINLGRISCEPTMIRYVSEVFSLVEICRRKLKTLLKVSYHNSAEYWSAHTEAKKLAALRCGKELPPPSPQPDPEITSPNQHVISPDLLEPYAVVYEDHVTVSPSKPIAPKKTQCVKKLAEIMLHGDGPETEPETEKPEPTTLEERIFSLKELETMNKVEAIIGRMEKERLVSICDECDWDEDDILECILLKESLREITEETMQEESVNLNKLIQNEPPSIRTLLNLGEAVQSGSDKGDESEISSTSTASKTRYDSKDDTEVTTLALPPKVVKTLTDMFGQIVGLPSDSNIKIPVNSELASLLHSALYFAHIDGKIANAYKGKEKMRPMKLQKRNLPLVVPTASSVPFSEIVQYQSKLPERKGKMKRLVAAYPGMDEHFLESVLSSCGNELQKAMRALSTESVRLQYLDDEEKLYSSKTEYTRERPKEEHVEYAQITQPPRSNTYTDNHIIIHPGTLIEQAEAYRELSGHNLNQAKLWHSKKKGIVAGHYAKQGTKYRELAEEAEMKLFDGTVVKDRLRDLKLNPVLDLHGFTLSQSKYLLNKAIDHYNQMIGQEPEFPRTLSVITGKGLHSAGGVSKLKPGIKTHLNILAIPYYEESDGYKIKFRS